MKDTLKVMCEYACRELPKGYILSIRTEHGAEAWVDVVDSGGILYDEDDMWIPCDREIPLAERVRWAVDWCQGICEIVAAEHQCKWSRAWAGRCQTYTEDPSRLCAEHRGKVCLGCGATATRECPSADGQFVCGAFLCDTCTHSGGSSHG